MGNPGKYFADTISGLIGAEKVLVQKSGYFARASAANNEDQQLIKATAEMAVQKVMVRESGVVAMDEDKDNEMRCIEFPRIKGGKPFNMSVPWFRNMMTGIGQEVAVKAE